MGRAPRQLPDGCSRPITLRCNSRAFLISRGVGSDLLPLPEAWHQLAERFGRANGARASNWEVNPLW